MGRIATRNPRLRLALLLWVVAAIAVICCGCREEGVYLPAVTGTTHSFTAAEVQPLPDKAQKRFAGQIACLVKDKPGILVGPAAAGLPTRAITDQRPEDLSSLQWLPDGRTIATQSAYADATNEQPLGEASTGTLGLLNVETGDVTPVDPDRLLDMNQVAANQRGASIVYAGVFQGKEGLLATETDTMLSTKVLVPDWSVCPGGVSVSTDGALAAKSEGAGSETGDGSLTIVSIADSKRLLSRDESEKEGGLRHSWSSPVFHPTVNILGYVQTCDAGKENDAIVLTALDAGTQTTDCYSLPSGCCLGSDLSWSPDGRYLAADGLDAEGHPWVWLLDLKEQRLWKWLEGVDRLAWGPEKADVALTASAPAGSATPPNRMRGDGLPASAVWIQDGRVATWPRDLKLPSGLREATGLRRLMKTNASSIVWVQETGPMHDGFRVSLGDLKTQKTTALVSGVDAFGMSAPDWELENVTLSSDGTRAVFTVRLAGSGMFIEYYDVLVAAPAKPRYLEEADVWDCVSRDGTMRVRYGWAMPDEGGANSDRYGYIEVLRKGEVEPNRLWKLTSVQQRAPWAEMIDVLTVSPDGARIAYSTSGAVWMVASDQRPARPSRLVELMPDQLLTHLVWTPDGQKLVANIAPADGDPEGWHETQLIDPGTGKSTGMAAYLEGLVFLE